jgi:hypothetical protein
MSRSTGRQRIGCALLIGVPVGGPYRCYPRFRVIHSEAKHSRAAIGAAVLTRISDVCGLAVIRQRIATPDITVSRQKACRKCRCPAGVRHSVHLCSTGVGFRPLEKIPRGISATAHRTFSTASTQTRPSIAMQNLAGQLSEGILGAIVRMIPSMSRNVLRKIPSTTAAMRHGLQPDCSVGPMRPLARKVEFSLFQATNYPIG